MWLFQAAIRRRVRRASSAAMTAFAFRKTGSATAPPIANSAKMKGRNNAVSRSSSRHSRCLGSGGRWTSRNVSRNYGGGCGLGKDPLRCPPTDNSLDFTQQNTSLERSRNSAFPWSSLSLTSTPRPLHPPDCVLPTSSSATTSASTTLTVATGRGTATTPAMSEAVLILPKVPFVLW